MVIQLDLKIQGQSLGISRFEASSDYPKIYKVLLILDILDLTT